MGRPNQCNPCCGGSEQPPPPPPDNPFDNYYCKNIVDCNGYVDDYVIVFQRINNSQPVSFSYYYLDFDNYNGEDPPEYWQEGCIHCIKGSNLIANASCTIPANNIIKNPCGSNTIYHGYCGGYEFILIVDGFILEDFVINNAIIVGTYNGYWTNCCDTAGYHGFWGWLNYAKCACIGVYVPPESEVTIEYYDCYSERMLGLSSVNSSNVTSLGGMICVPPYSFSSLIDSIREDWRDNICTEGFESCSFDSNIDIWSFGDRIRIISGNPSFTYNGVCEYEESAPQCLKDLAIQCGE